MLDTSRDAEDLLHSWLDGTSDQPPPPSPQHNHHGQAHRRRQQLRL
jgi:hypothetical protein